jgi:hypothetical protein
LDKREGFVEGRIIERDDWSYSTSGHDVVVAEVVADMLALLLLLVRWLVSRVITTATARFRRAN